ncbi:MAG: cytochrome C oxidase subunit IV family protein [Acidobacteria bacterium]|nr:cytochrome C oxidase subunit IV family protein [Acidobacteriota bacterium]
MTHSHLSGFRDYLLVWAVLAVLTIVALAVGELQLTRNVAALIYVVIALAKVILIASIFMHLRLERATLATIAAIPLVFAAALVIGIFLDSHDSATRFILSLQ